MRIFALVGAALWAATPLAAQITSTNQIVGWTNSPVMPWPGELQMQDVDGGCQAAKRLCPALFCSTPLAGGVAYDPRYQAVWVSDSRKLDLIDLNTCTTLCTSKPSIMSPNAELSGLAMSDEKRLLYHLETRPGYLGIMVYGVDRCPPQPCFCGCSLAIHPQGVAGGLAYDEVRDLLYYTVTFPGAIQSVHELHVAKGDDRCNPVCKVIIPGCEANFDNVTGLAYDSCSEILYATTGTETRRIKVIDPLRCKFEFLDCCKKQTGGGFWAGLSVVPGWERKDFGRSCVDPSCPPCNNMNHEVLGDPSLGNREFASVLNDAPARNSGFFAVGYGGCHKGTRLPFMCEALFVPLGPATAFVGPVYLGTGPSCTGRARIDMPIPPAPALCGQAFCCQWGVLCTGTKVGLGISNAIHFTVTGS